jgi:uncharacterized membrane protein YeiH
VTDVTWDYLNIIATVAFAFSGAIVALEEKYDVFGIYILGLAASFGGGILRNVLLGLPIKPIWEQGVLLETALISITVFYILPKRWIYEWNHCNTFIDAVGLSAFAIQGAIFAIDLKFPLGAVILSAVVTGIGGGIVRDVLAGRKPVILQQEIYAVWAMSVGFILGLGWIDKNNVIQLILLFVIVTGLRVLSIVYKWHLRFRDLEKNDSPIFLRWHEKRVE